MAVSFFDKVVYLHMSNGEVNELSCADETMAAQLAYAISDHIADVVFTLQEQENNEPVRTREGVSRQIRVTCLGKTIFVGTRAE